MPTFMKRATSAIRQALRAHGLDLVRYRPGFGAYVDDLAAETMRIVRPYTMTADESLFSLIQAVRYVVRSNISGSFVECGVWRGGSVMAVALTLQQIGVTDRDLYLFDTFDGMTAPTGVDILLHNVNLSASAMLAETALGDGANVWCRSPLKEVEAALGLTGYPPAHLHFVQGPVETTLPAQAPNGPIALLRLDTDWYESTRQELEHLVPSIPLGGVLAIDDYWHWGGCRRAVDEYLDKTHLQVFLSRVDITAIGTIHRHEASSDQTLS